MTTRFESRLRRVVAWWTWLFGTGTAIAVLVVLYDEGGDPSEGLWFMVAFMAALYLLIVALAWKRGLARVEVGEHDLRILRRRGETVVPWADVGRYRHHRGRSESWRFDLRDGRREAFLVEGFASGEGNALAEAIYERLVAHGLAEPAERPGRYRPVG